MRTLVLHWAGAFRFALAILVLLCSEAWLGAAELPKTQAKLAIISTDPSGDVLADGLTVELARVDGITVLERAEVVKLVSEQRLGAMSSASLLKAGGILGADGLVVLEPRKLAKSIDVKLRLIGVRRGVALGWWAYGVAQEQIVNWPKGVADRLKPLLPKMAAATLDAKPLSFVGFTSPSISRSSAELERTVNSLLLNRLGAEPDLLVLERQQLLDAAFEKILSTDDRKFWNGAYLVQGTLNPDQISSDSVSVRFSLAVPGAATSKELAVTGQRTNLAALAQQFVSEVRRALNSGTNQVTWDAAAEAKRFYEQAENAVRWQFWPEARAAADTALALGKDGLDTRLVRLRAYIGLFKIDRRKFTWNECKPRFGLLEHYTLAPSPGELAAALDAAYQLQGLATSLLELPKRPLQPAITEALDAIGHFTFRYYMGAELRVGNEQKLEALRAAMRDFVDSVLNKPEVANSFIPGLLKFGPLWCETPERGVTVHQRVRTLSGFAAFEEASRPISLGTGGEADETDWTPKLFGWKWSDRSRADDVWDAFIRQARTLPPVVRQPQKTETLPAANLLETLSLAVSNKTLPPAQVVAQTRSLTDLAELLRAHDLLVQLRGLPPAGSDPMARMEVHRSILWMNAVKKIGFTNSSDQLTSLKRPGELKPAGAMNMTVSNPTAKEQPQKRVPVLNANVITLTNGTWNSPYTVLWAENKLWVLFEAASMFSWTTETQGGGTKRVAQCVIAAFDGTNCVETNSIPEKFLSLLERKENMEMAVFSDRILLFLEQGIVTCNRKGSSFSSAPSPLRSPRAFARGDRLYLYNEESILETTPDLKEFKVLASVRRRPAVTPLDEFPALKNPHLLQAGGRLLLAVGDKTFLFDEARWNPVDGRCPGLNPDDSEVLLVSYAMDEIVLRHDLNLAGSPNPAVIACYYGKNSAQPECWWSNVSKSSDGSGSAPGARYPLLPVGAPFYFQRGRIVGISRQAAFPFSGQLLTLSLSQDPKAPGQLQFWRTNSAQPVTLSVAFPGREKFMAFGDRVLLAGNRIYHWKGPWAGLARIAEKIWYVEAESAFNEVAKLASAEPKANAQNSESK